MKINRYCFKTSWICFILLGILLFGNINTSLFAQNQNDAESVFQKANQAFRDAKYNEAKQLYLEVTQRGDVSAKLYFNLGNTFYKLKDYTYAVLYYEKAILLDPSNEDIKYNLTLVRGLVGDKSDEVRPFFLTTWMILFTALNSTDQWAWWALGSFVFFSLFVILFFMMASLNIKKISILLSFLFLVSFIICLSSSYYRLSLLKNSKQAIVGQPAVNAKSSPSQDGNDIFIVHEGTKVQMLDSVGLWKEIQIPDGNRGWVSKDNLLPI